MVGRKIPAMIFDFGGRSAIGVVNAKDGARAMIISILGDEFCGDCLKL